MCACVDCDWQEDDHPSRVRAGHEIHISFQTWLISVSFADMHNTIAIVNNIITDTGWNRSGCSQSRIRERNGEVTIVPWTWFVPSLRLILHGRQLKSVVKCSRSQRASGTSDVYLKMLTRHTRRYVTVVMSLPWFFPSSSTEEKVVVCRIYNGDEYHRVIFC